VGTSERNEGDRISDFRWQDLYEVMVSGWSACGCVLLFMFFTVAVVLTLIAWLDFWYAFDPQRP